MNCEFVDCVKSDVGEDAGSEPLKPTPRQGSVDPLIQRPDESPCCGVSWSVVARRNLPYPDRVDSIAHRPFERLDHRIVRVLGNLYETDWNDDGRNAFDH